MPYKIMMSIVATVPLIFLIAFVAVPEFFVLQSYPSAEGLALEIAITHRYDMAGILFMVVCFAFLSRNVEGVDNQKAILLGAAIAFSAMAAPMRSPSHHSFHKFR
jgi:hypothetical protein